MVECLVRWILPLYSESCLKGTVDYENCCWLNLWHATQFSVWMAGTPHGCMIGWLAHHAAVWLDDWPTTKIYDKTTGTPYMFVTGCLAHHTALWLNDWHITQLLTGRQAQHTA